MVLEWFNVTDVKRFANDIAAQYGRLRKSSALRMDDASKRIKKVEKLIQEVREFTKAGKLNIYKRARLVKEMSEGMRSLQIPESEISAFMDSVLVTDLRAKR